jgi:RNA polymerase sigma-70 factor (ECF subfamily)
MALSAADESEQAEALDRALALVRTLPPDQAEAVLLRVVGDLSVAEVAAILGRREGTVRVLVHRGLKRLAERSVVTESPVRTMSAS